MTSPQRPPTFNADVQNEDAQTGAPASFGDIDVDQQYSGSPQDISGSLSRDLDQHQVETSNQNAATQPQHSFVDTTYHQHGEARVQDGVVHPTMPTAFDNYVNQNSFAQHANSRPFVNSRDPRPRPHVDQSLNPLSFGSKSIEHPYVEMGSSQDNGVQHAVSGSHGSSYNYDEDFQLTPQEIVKLKELLRGGKNNNVDMHSFSTAMSLDSDYPEFSESTTAWAVFADNPKKRAGAKDRLVGTTIIVFQLFTYWLFAAEAIEDYQNGRVVVKIGHEDCVAAGEEPGENFTCEAEFTNDLDAFVAYFMLGVFLTGDFLQAVRAIRDAPFGNTLVFACFAAFEVVCAYVAACIAISYNLYIGEVTDAVEVGVGLLFIRELSQRAYTGIRYGNTKQYKSFFGVLALLIATGMLLDPLFEHVFAAKSYR